MGTSGEAIQQLLLLPPISMGSTLIERNCKIILFLKVDICTKIIHVTWFQLASRYTLTGNSLSSWNVTQSGNRQEKSIWRKVNIPAGSFEKFQPEILAGKKAEKTAK